MKIFSILKLLQNSFCKKKLGIFFCTLLISCSVKDVSYRYPDNPDYARKNRAGAIYPAKNLAKSILE